MSAATIREQWDRLAAAHADAAAQDAAIDAEFDRTLAEKGEGDPTIKEIEAKWDRTGWALNECQTALLLAPAPDHLAVRWKMQTLFGQEHAEGGPDDPYISALHRRFTDAIMADMDRLQSEFAEAWLAKWTEDGGTVLIFEGKAQFAYPVYELSPRYVEPADHMDQQFAERFVLTNGQHYHSTMNARVDALRTMPGGTEAIKAHMRSKREIQRGRGLSASIGQLVGAVVDNLEITEGEGA